MCSCVGITRPDKRDKYVGEYKLYEHAKWHGQHRGYTRNYFTQSYNMEWYEHEKIDTTQTLIVKKVPSDTVSLIFYIVKPFDFERAERIRQENEDIKKRNAESICGKDEPLQTVPTPSYDNTRDLVKSYNGYVEGHKIFLSDFTKRSNDHGYGYEASYKFDSVFLRNDTLRFILQQHWDFLSPDIDGEWRSQKERYIAVKNATTKK